MNKKNTRQKILESGAALVHAQGFNNTGLQEILKQSCVPKGSFYYYFKSKEAFGLALIDFHIERTQHNIDIILQKKVSPLRQMEMIFAWFMEQYYASGFKNGCPFGNLIQEMSDLNPDFRKKLLDAMKKMENLILRVLTLAQKQGQVRAEINIQEVAALAVAAWQGTAMMIKLQKNDVPYMQFKKLLFSTLLQRPNTTHA